MNKDSLFTKAMQCYNNSLYCEAVELFEKILHDDPNQEECYFYAGRCYENVSYESKAIEYYSRGIKECLNDEYISDYHLHIGNCYIMLSKIDNAILHYDEASKFDGNYIIAQLNKAKAFMCIKEYKKALDIFEKAKNIDNCNEVDDNILNNYVKYCQTKVYEM